MNSVAFVFKFCLVFMWGVGFAWVEDWGTVVLAIMVVAGVLWLQEELKENVNEEGNRNVGEEEAGNPERYEGNRSGLACEGSGDQECEEEEGGTSGGTGCSGPGAPEASTVAEENDEVWDHLRRVYG